MIEENELISKYHYMIPIVIRKYFKNLYTDYLREEAFSGGLIGLWKGVERVQSLNIPEGDRYLFMKNYITWGIREVLRSNTGMKRVQFKRLSEDGDIPEFECIDEEDCSFEPQAVMDDPLDILIDKEKMHLLALAIKRLPHPDREYLVRRIRGDKLQDIAKEVGEAPETGCRRVKEAVVFLRGLLKRRYNA